MKKKFSLRALGSLLKDSIKGFSRDKVPKLSGSLAYTTIFSMAPLLVVIISVCSIFFGQEAVTGKIYGQLEGFLGHDTAIQIQEVIKGASLSGKGPTAMVIGIVILLIGSTAVFGEIQDSINIIWGLKAKPKSGIIKMLLNRFLSFSVIISLGFLLLVSLSLSTLVDGFSEWLNNRYPESAIILFYVINQVLTLLFTTLIFAVIFKVLPDARIKWKDVLAGAFTTAVFFMLGKFLISLYISQSKAGSTFGPAAAIIVLLIWVYFSSIILYFGAEFTKAYAVKYGAAIHPNDYAVTVKEVTIETGSKSVQEKEKKTVVKA
jgi:membrane protein